MFDIDPNFIETINTFNSVFNDNTEFEIRLGFYDSNNRFISSVNKNIFDRIFIAHNNKFPKQSLKISDSFVNNIRYSQIKVKNNQNQASSSYFLKTTKTNILKNDFPEYNFRLSLSSEENEVIKTLPENLPPFLRVKERTIFYLIKDVLELHMTVVNKKNFEVELEIKKPNKLNVISNYIMELLKIAQNSSILISKSEQNYILQTYKNLFNQNKKLIGPQPVPFTKKELINFNHKNYAVTNKLDGQRTLLFIHNNKIYKLTNKSHGEFLGISVVKNLPNNYFYNDTILDTEFLNNTFYVFDVLYLRKEVLLQNNNYDLFKRLGWGQKITNELKEKFKLNIEMKNFYTNSKNIFSEGINIFLNQKSSIYNKNIDGLIFIPIGSLPKSGTWDKLYKWKFPEMISVDLKIQKEGNKWDLLVNNGKTYQVFEKQPFIFVEKEINDKYNDNSIVEFVMINNSLKPLKERTDKSDSNFITIAYDTYELMQDAPTIEDLETSGVSEDFIKMRKYHNIIKNTILQDYVIKYFGKINNLISIGSGKGGDLHKWIKNNISKVYGLDINNDYIKEANERKLKLSEQYPLIKTNYNFINKDIGKSLLKSNSKVDAVEANFSFHYFLKDENYLNMAIKGISNVLKPGGVFYGTFLDGDYIEKIDSKKIQLSSSVYIEKKYNNSANLTGNNLTVKFPGETITESNEYLFKMSLFSNYMKKHDFVLKYFINFSQIKNPFKSELSKAEVLFSNMFSFFIFQYEPNNKDDELIDTLTALKLQQNIISKPIEHLNVSWEIFHPPDIYMSNELTEEDFNFVKKYDYGILYIDENFNIINNTMTSNQNFINNKIPNLFYIVMTPTDDDYYYFIKYKNLELFDKAQWTILLSQVKNKNETTYNIIYTQEQLEILTIPQLQEITEKMNLKKQGNKENLINRILQNQYKM